MWRVTPGWLRAAADPFRIPVDYGRDLDADVAHLDAVDSAPAESRPIQIHVHFSGCFLSRDEWILLSPSGDGYEAPGGGRISRAAVDRLRHRIVESAPRKTDPWYSELGFTAASFEEHRGEVRQAVLGEEWRGAGNQLPALDEEARACFAEEALVRSLTQFFAPHSTSSTSLSILLPGEPRVWILAASDVPGKLPLHVFVDRESWRSFDPRLAGDLADLAPEHLAGDLRGAPEYWPAAAWKDARVWARVKEEVSAVLGVQLLQRLPGHDEVVRRFDLLEASTRPGLEPGLPTSAVLLARLPSLIDALHWSAHPPGDEAPDWRPLLEEYDRVAAAAAEFPWLQAWKDAEEGRRITLHLRPGNRLGGYQPFERAIVAACKDAGLPEAPVTLLGLEVPIRYPLATRSHMRCMSAALVAGADRLLVVETQAVGGLRAPGDVNFRVDRTGTYAVVRTQGEPEFRALPGHAGH